MPALTRPPSDETGQSDDAAWEWGAEFLTQLLNRAAEHRSATKYGAAGIQSPNDEVERRRIALPPNEADYLHHRLPPWLTEDAAPRSLEPLVRRVRAAERSISFVISRLD